MTLLKINCNSPAPVGDHLQGEGDRRVRDILQRYREWRAERKREFDCSESYRDFFYLNEGEGKISPFRCRQWKCKVCGPKMRRKLIGEIARVAASWGSPTRLMTLTLDPAKIEGDSIEYIQNVWRKFRVYVEREKRKIEFVAIREFHKSGIVHLHVLVSAFLPQRWISAAWSRLGGGRVVDIRAVDVQRVGPYLSKYLSKDFGREFPPRKRRYTSSRGVKMALRGRGGGGWVLVRLWEGWLVSVLPFDFLDSWGRSSLGSRNGLSRTEELVGKVKL